MIQTLFLSSVTFFLFHLDIHTIHDIYIIFPRVPFAIGGVVTLTNIQHLLLLNVGAHVCQFDQDFCTVLFLSLCFVTCWVFELKVWNISRLR